VLSASETAINSESKPAVVRVRFDPLPIAMAIPGICCVLLGAAIVAKRLVPLPNPLVGWSEAAPNAGIGLIVGGLALIALAWGRGKLALAGAVCSLYLGIATLAEFLYSMDLHIDQAVIRDRWTRGAFPGRIGPDVAFGFVLAGIVFWWASARRRQWQGAAAMGLLSAVVFATGGASACEYLTGVPSYGWPVAPDAAIGLLLLGAGLLAVVGWRDRQQEGGFPPWLMGAIAAGGVVVSLCFGHALSALDIDRIAGRKPKDIPAVLRAVEGELPLLLTGIGVLVALLLVLMANQILISRRQARESRSEAARLGVEVTERMKAEDALARQAVELAHYNAELKQFADGASHELQEPLRAVASFTQLLAERYQGRLDGDADALIGFAQDGSRRAQDLIQELFVYSGVGTRGAPFARTESETVLESVQAILAAALEQTGGQVTHDPLPVVNADRNQLGLLFQNLIGNAIKFHGGAAPRVHISAVPMDQMWRFSVQDSGIGIEKRDWDRVFVIFQRLNPPEAYPGAGVGLAICKKIVERHGGKIWLESRPGQGTTVHFTVPAMAEETAGSRAVPLTSEDPVRS